MRGHHRFGLFPRGFISFMSLFALESGLRRAGVSRVNGLSFTCPPRALYSASNVALCPSHARFSRGKNYYLYFQDGQRTSRYASRQFAISFGSINAKD